MAAEFWRWYGSIFEMPKGHYRLAYKPDHSLTASIRCPSCDQVFSVTHHTYSQGTLVPSVICPHDGCTFHDNVLLVGTH